MNFDAIARLEEMAEKAASAWPSLPEWLIDNAFDLVTDKADKVIYMHDLPNTGDDVWTVDGTETTIRGGYCSCKRSQDRGPCVHRLAVMFRKRLDDAVFDMLAEAYAGAPDDVRVVLFADVYFGQAHGGKDLWKLKGFRVNGSARVNLGYDGRVTFTEERLGEVLREAGWMVTSKMAQGGYQFDVYTEQMDAYHAKQQPEIDTGAGQLRAISPHAAARKAEREKFGDLFERVLDATMGGAVPA